MNKSSIIVSFNTFPKKITHHIFRIVSVTYRFSQTIRLFDIFYVQFNLFNELVPLLLAFRTF